MTGTPFYRELGERLRLMFAHNSGRVIALTRLVLAAVFFLALWVDPDLPVRSSVTGYVLLFSYLLLASALLAIAWRSWWWDHRLAWPAMLLDIFAFLSAVFFTEGAVDDFSSPFMAFFAFLMLAATIRWDWGMTVITGVAVTGLYLMVGSYIATIDSDFDLYRFGRRIIYMMVLSLILAWFGLQRRAPFVGRFVELPQDTRHGTLLEQAMRYAVKQADAGSGAIAWVEYEEPMVQIRTWGFESSQDTLGPHELDSDTGFSIDACLFDRPRRRYLVASGTQRTVARRREVEDTLAELTGIDEGITLPLVGLTGRGELLLCDIEGLNADHVELGALLAREIVAGFDRHATLELANDAALARMRDSLARDLHDSVAQSLAGASLRLEGLRNWIKGGGDPEAEIDAMKASLRDEQKHVRSLIERLREGSALEETVDLASSARALLNALAVQWGVAARLIRSKTTVLTSLSLAHEMSQLLREAVANAVRHGGAAHVDVSFTTTGEELKLTIDDDGKGFPDGNSERHPRSISERVEKLSGKLAVMTGRQGTRLEIRLPLEKAR